MSLTNMISEDRGFETDEVERRKKHREDNSPPPPTFKLILMCSDKPYSKDELKARYESGFYRRIPIIPFTSIYGQNVEDNDES